MLVHSSFLHPQSYEQGRETRSHEQFPLFQFVRLEHLICCNTCSGAIGTSIVVKHLNQILRDLPYFQAIPVPDDIHVESDIQLPMMVVVVFDRLFLYHPTFIRLFLEYKTPYESRESHFLASL